MNIKRKLILIGICVVIIIVVFTVNVLQQLKGDQNEVVTDTTKENVITRAEAYRLLSYLYYDKQKRESIPLGITYADSQMSGWYDTYVNAVWKMGLIEGNITISPDSSLTYGNCKELIDNLIIKSPEFQSVYTGISFEFTNAEEDITIPEFLEIYEAILAAVPADQQRLSHETLFVLGKEVLDGKDRMVTDQGKYYYLNAADYEMFYTSSENKDLTLNTGEGKVEEGTPTDTPSREDTWDTLISPDKVSSENQKANQTEKSKVNLVDLFMDKGIHALVCGQEIVYITSETTEKIILHNVWIKKGEGTQVEAYVNGLDKSFTAGSKLSSNIEKVVGNIAIENQKITQISVKPDMIQGKVLRTGEDFIEIEGYGEIPLEENYKIYKIYGEISMEPTSSILVGYENTSFIVSEGKISAALITGKIKAENIRVLLKTSSYKGIYHDKVQLTATTDFTVASGEKKTSYKAGEKVTIQPEDELFIDGRIMVETVSEKGKIKILSIKRSSGNPKYRGRIEITKEDKGLLLVNELPLEEYLYSVIPSEMPTSYGQEALKVQAVCARSYAYRHLLSNSLSEFGAHVDDSVTYQVYNNLAENEDSILAVKDTFGKVIEYEGEVINAYYFSTSCGHTTEPTGAWANEVNLPYLQGKLLLIEEEGEGAEAQSEAYDLYENLSSEVNFKKFIEAKDITTYDSSFNWYRWKVTIDVKNLKKVIDANLANRYNANPELIVTKTSDSDLEGEEVFASLPVDTVGTIVDIKVLNREKSGNVSEILITGSENTIKVRTEYNIRALLAPTYDEITRADESKVESLKLLPSSFFRIDKKENSNKLSSITITGGGYGHGVGLSQNGVKALADSGKKYDYILSYFYEDTQLGYIYE